MSLSNLATRQRPRLLLNRALIAFALVAASIAAPAFAQEQPMSPPAASGADKAAQDAAEAAMSANTDWPCVQHKQPVLTAAQMWDGPAVAIEGKSSEDPAIQKIVPVLVSRRISMDEVEKDIKAFADAQSAQTRDAKLAELFEASLANINITRKTVMDGIERFQRQQIRRSKKLEEEGIELAKLQQASEANLKDQDAARRADEAQSRYDWDARVFQERQQNVPIACEIPVLIEQRIFALAQTIRNHMAN